MSKTTDKRNLKTQMVDAAEAKRRHDVMDAAILNHQGVADELEGALGMYMLGRHVGWKVLYLIHTKRTVARYEEILNINVREEFDEVGPDAERSRAWRIAKTLSNFWKVVSGDEKLGLEREERRTLQ